MTDTRTDVRLVLEGQDHDELGSWYNSGMEIEYSWRLQEAEQFRARNLLAMSFHHELEDVPSEASEMF